VLKSIPRKRNSDLITSCFLYATALLTAVGLKYHYSQASGDALGWILGPTAGVVEYTSGIRFEMEACVGYINHEYGIIIAPACAGVNFLIIAFCMSAYSGFHQLRSSRLKFIWLGISFVCAYILTISVNALRIIVSIHTIIANIQYPWITQDRLHLIEGILIYFITLYLFYLINEKMIHFCIGNGLRKKRNWRNKDNNYNRIIITTFIPFFWYALFTMGVPFLNQFFNKNSPLFIEYCLFILSVCTVVFIFIFLIQLCLLGIWSKIGYNGKCRFIFGYLSNILHRMNIQGHLKILK